MVDALEAAENAAAADGVNAAPDPKGHAGGWTSFNEVLQWPLRWNTGQEWRRRY